MKAVRKGGEWGCVYDHPPEIVEYYRTELGIDAPGTYAEAVERVKASRCPSCNSPAHPRKGWLRCEKAGWKTNWYPDDVAPVEFQLRDGKIVFRHWLNCVRRMNRNLRRRARWQRAQRRTA